MQIRTIIAAVALAASSASSAKYVICEEDDESVVDRMIIFPGAPDQYITLNTHKTCASLEPDMPDWDFCSIVEWEDAILWGKS